MSKIVKPFGILAKQITIKTDVNGLMIVEAFDVVPEVSRGFRPYVSYKPMDSREMVLALIKVVNDYCVVMFASMGEKGPVDGQKNTNDDNKRQPG